MPPIRTHLFVCQNERPAHGKPSCGARGSGALLAAFHQAIGAQPGLWGQVAVTPCGCLGPCFEGPMLVVYPEGVWYRLVTPLEVAEILDAHAAGGTVERLRYRWPADEGDDSP